MEIVVSSYIGSLLGLLLILFAHYRAEAILGAHRHTNTLLNAIAGIAIAYAFIDVFPHLARKQPIIDSVTSGPIETYLTNHVYLMALLGFCVYVGIRVFSVAEVDRRHSRPAYRVLVASMCLYAMFVGYMLAEQPLYRPEPAILFALAMAAHFLGLHHELMHDRPQLYNKLVRFLLMSSTAIGWVGSFFYTISQPVFALGFAYIAGGIVAAGAISDLPRVTSVRAFVAFLAGALLYSILLLAIEAFRLKGQSEVWSLSRAVVAESSSRWRSSV